MVAERADPAAYDAWLIIEVASEPNNSMLANWLIELLVNVRDVSPTAAARYVSALQHLGRVAAELISHTAPTPRRGCHDRARVSSRNGT